MPKILSDFTVLSNGLGQDSTAILYKYIYDKNFRAKYAPKDFLVLTASTEDEHPATYKQLEVTRYLCDKHGIEYHFITPDMGFHPTHWQGLRFHFEEKKTIMSKVFMKSCTDNLKIKPIYNFLGEYIHERYNLESYGKKTEYYEFKKRFGAIRMLIGIARGEESRVSQTSPHAWMRYSIYKEFPLITEGMDRADCQQYIRSVGHEVPFPSNCILCPFMNKIELLFMYRFLRDDYNYWVKRERIKMEHDSVRPFRGDKRPKSQGVWGTKPLPDILQDAIAKHGHMTNEELVEYKMSHGHCVKSKY